ncbi:serine/threonine-protein kinase [Silvibacterium bohemicum]|uniref:non-specific serine/threonine protein kinase n=1 Tax=Silvibacterium bohemicum TaxID=1577686 RepID=A0A841JWM9_9BACT|nr:serine/threonine-protein kinase [Silvibacterium bohemicum]MBB6145813.1 serine/threonine-protein kinase [Silvibacterium bohemicum]
MAFEIGQRVGDYEIVGILGKGGLGQVYEASHVISQRREALKALLTQERSGEEVGERFRREIQLLGALSHPNIASLHNAFYHDGQLVMVMELVKGKTLRDKSVRTRIPVPQVLQYTCQVLSALDYAHQRGVVHRDVKPTNIMITENDQAKLLDFGIAISERSAELTAPGFMVGSVSYMSPEQIAGDKATSKSDIYAVGVMLYEILTGRLPAKGESNFEIMRSHLSERPVPPQEVDPRLPQSLSVAILKALEKDPADRFATARDFLAALEAIPQTFIDELLSSPTRTMAVPSSGSFNLGISGSPSQPRSSQVAAFPLDDVTKKLAVFIGPIASVLVRKLAPKCANLDDLYKEAAMHIPAEVDRQRFLRSKGTSRP